MVVCCKSTMPDSGRGRLTPSKRKFLRAAAILQLAQFLENFKRVPTSAENGQAQPDRRCIGKWRMRALI
jgi:hypothetical protein